LVKLQFSKTKRHYKHKTYEYERFSLHFPIESNKTLQPLRDKQLKITVTKQDGTYNVSLSNSEDS